MRETRSTYLRWWQIRPTDFGLILLPILIERALALPLWILAVTHSDFDDLPLSFTLDATYAGWHAPSAVKHIIILGWILLGVAILSAALDRCYKFYKAGILFTIIAALMVYTSLNALDLYEPYLALRR